MLGLLRYELFLVLPVQQVKLDRVYHLSSNVYQGKIDNYSSTKLEAEPAVCRMLERSQLHLPERPSSTGPPREVSRLRPFRAEVHKVGSISFSSLIK